MGELIDGTLYASPRPARPHAHAQSRLLSLVGTPFDLGRGGPGGWTILFEPELHLSKDAVVPDLAGWRSERLRDTPFDVAYFTVAPDWVCEVLSPSTARLDRGSKLRVYARERVSYVWLVDPTAQMIEVFTLQDAGYGPPRIVGDEESVRLAPFEAMELPLPLLWAQ